LEFNQKVIFAVPLQSKHKAMSRIFTITFLVISLQFSAQTRPAKYIIKLKDKNASAKSIIQPESFLSTKAIARRDKHRIEINNSDLPVSSDYKNAIRAKGAKIVYQSKWLNTLIVEATDPFFIEKISSLKFVTHIAEFKDFSSTKNRKTSGKPFFINETYKPYNHYLSAKSGQSGASFNYGSAFNQINMISGNQLHDMGYRGDGMTIAVIDAGFNSADVLPAFDSLWLNDQILGTHDFVEPNNNVFNTAISSHGMMVLSTMGGNLPGQIVGTAPKASYWLLRSEDARNNDEYLMEEYYWVNAAEFADSVGADVINSSLGYTEFDNPDENHTYADMDGNTTPITIGADMAAKKGILVVNSAGNSAYDPWHYVGAPADGDSVLSIGAVDPQGNYAPFSSTGPTYDGRIKPNIAAQGAPAAVADLSGGVVFGSGTSFSSPIIAGMSACLWQANSNYSNMDIINALQESASQSENPDSLLGYGIPNYVTANILLSVNDNTGANKNNVIISPNPFRTAFSIGFPVHASFGNTIQVSLESVNGSKVFVHTYSITGNGKIIVDNLSPLTSGVYILTVNCESNRWVKKVVKY
jgi:serine protease AprX